jgi:hypothetical protein
MGRNVHSDYSNLDPGMVGRCKGEKAKNRPV